MNLTRFLDAVEYFPPEHDGMTCLRLQGHEAGPSDALWLGVSRIQPGGGTSLAASPMEKHYVVLEGEVAVETPEGEVILKQYDSCRLAPGEQRALHNRGTQVSLILLAMPYGKKE